MRATRTILLGMLLPFLLACEEREYLALSGRVFIFNYRIATATYMVTLRKQKNIPEGSRAVVLFENPAGGAALRIEENVWPKMPSVNLESPPLTCVRKNRRYAFSVELLGPDGKRLQFIESSVLSTEDQSILPDKPLVVGPVYTPNPELAGHPDGKLPGTVKPVCPP